MDIRQIKCYLLRHSLLKSLVDFPAFPPHNGLSISVLLATFLLEGTLCLGICEFKNVEFVKEKSVGRKLVHIRRAEEKPDLDGELIESCWNGATISSNFLKGLRPSSNPTELRAAFDDDYLYIAAKCQIVDAKSLKNDMPATYRGGKVWNDDCVDFTISENGATQCQFVVNANGAWYAKRSDQKNWNPSIDVSTGIAEDSYTIEMAIPLKEIGLKGSQPTSALLAFGRVDRTTGSEELSTALGERWGDLKTAPLYILGVAEEAEEKRLINKHDPAIIGGEVKHVDLYLDRDRYPAFQHLGTGRFCVKTSASGLKNESPSLTLSVIREGDVVSRKTIADLTSPKVDFDITVGELEPGDYELLAVFGDGDKELGRAVRSFRVTDDDKVERAGIVRVEVPPTVASWDSWPITFGAPFPRGALSSPDNVKMLDSENDEVPIQVKVACAWSKHGSVKWLLVTFMPKVGPFRSEYRLVYGPDVERALKPLAPMVNTDDNEVEVDTGKIKFKIPRRVTPGMTEVWLDDGNGEPVKCSLAGKEAGPAMLDAAGDEYFGMNSKDVEVDIEEDGPLRTVIKVSGFHENEKHQRLGKYVMRFCAWRGLPFIELRHTFIITEEPGNQKYRDIRYAFPFKAEEYFFGTDKGSAGTVGKVGARLIQLDDLKHKIYEEGVFKDEGGKASGWMSARNRACAVTVAVRDFWQNFPKELEVENDSLKIHFWPMHGETPLRTGDGLSVRNVYQQWFVHEGDVLDFTIPEEVLEYVRKDSPHHCYPNAKKIHAMGLAKTHETLFYFHRKAWEEANARDVASLFQENPIAVVSPKWVAETEALGAMRQRDPERFPVVERALDKTFELIRRYQMMDRDYGMFNYGNAHHNWDARERRWNLHRIWYNIHHGWARWPWLMYARSGDKRVFDYARANATMAADVAHCHYSTKRWEAESWPEQKLVGGICDYKGFSPWSAGGRAQYNSSADALLWSYYLTGDERSLKTAMDHGGVLLADARPWRDRVGSARVTSAVALYNHTWDNDYLEFIERHMDVILENQKENGAMSSREYWTPFLQRYLELTNSERGEKALKRWADYLVHDQRIPGSSGFTCKIDVLSYAYTRFGEAKYLECAARRIGRFANHLYLGDDPRFHGVFLNYQNNQARSCFMQWAPCYLKALSRHDEKLRERPFSAAQILTSEKTTIDGVEYVVFRAILRRGKEPVDIRPVISEAKDWLVSLEPVSEKPRPRKSETITLPGNGPREYELLILVDASKKSKFYVEVPFMEDPPAAAGEVYVHAREHRPLIGGTPLYFNVPEGTNEMIISFRGWDQFPKRIEVFNPEGVLVVGKTIVGGEKGCLTVDLSDQRREKWSFTLYGTRLGRALGLEKIETRPVTGRPFLYAISPELLFKPEHEL